MKPRCLKKFSWIYLNFKNLLMLIFCLLFLSTNKAFSKSYAPKKKHPPRMVQKTDEDIGNNENQVSDSSLTSNSNSSSAKTITVIGEKKKEEVRERTLTSIIVEQILKNVYQSKLDFNLDIDYSQSESSGKSEFKAVYNLFDLFSFIQFKEDMYLPTNTYETEDPQLAKVIPKIYINSKKLIAVGKADLTPDSNSDGKISLRFCSEYNENIDFCLPKRLVARAETPTFKNLLQLEFESISLSFSKPNAVGTYAFNGKCDSYKNKLDLKTGKIELTPVDCRFSGTYNFDSKVGFKINLKYKDKE